MTENTAAPETTVAAPAPKKAAPKKTAKKPAKKAPVKKGAKKAAKAVKTAKGGKKTAKKTAPRAKKEGLRKPQVRILAVLAKATKGLTRAQIGEKGGVDVPMMNSYIGAHDEKVRAKNDKIVCPSLLTLGYVKYAPQEEGAGVCYAITAAGKKAYEAAKAAK